MKKLITALFIMSLFVNILLILYLIVWDFIDDSIELKIKKYLMPRIENQFNEKNKDSFDGLVKEFGFEGWTLKVVSEKDTRERYIIFVSNNEGLSFGRRIFLFRLLSHKQGKRENV